MKKQGRPSEYESAIVAIVKEAPRGTHLTAPEVYAKARGNGLAVSISTVYRTLQRLKEEGNLSTVSGKRELRYESADHGPEHDHLICLSCGMTIEFIDERLPKFGQNVAKAKGFSHIKSRFDILGFCSKCHTSIDQGSQSKTSEHWQSAIVAAREALSGLISMQENFGQENLADEKIADLLARNEIVSMKLKEALANCEAAEDLL